LVWSKGRTVGVSGEKEKWPYISFWVKRLRSENVDDGKPGSETIR